MNNAVVVFVLFCLTGFGGCTTPAPISQKAAQQAVYGVKATYDTGLKVSIAYAKLPKCGSAGALPLCSDSIIVGRVTAVANSAKLALDAAQNVVDAPGFDENAFNQALISARGAVSGFVAITSTLVIN